MRQRNPGPYTIDFPTLDPPVRMSPGDEIDHDEILVGLQPVGREAKAAYKERVKEQETAAQEAVAQSETHIPVVADDQSKGA